MTWIRLDPTEFEHTGVAMRAAANVLGDSALDASQLGSLCCAPPGVQSWVDQEGAAVGAELRALSTEMQAGAQQLADRGAAVSAEATLPAVVGNGSAGLVTTTDPNDPNIVIAWDPNNPGTVAAWNRNNPTFVIGWNTSNPDTIVGFDPRNPTRAVAFSQSTGNAFAFDQGAPTGGVATPTIASVGGSWSTTATDAGFALAPLPTPSTGGYSYATPLGTFDPLVAGANRVNLATIYDNQAATNFNQGNLGGALEARPDYGGVGLYEQGYRQGSL
jgi:hypothetical protein